MPSCVNLSFCYKPSAPGCSFFQVRFRCILLLDRLHILTMIGFFDVVTILTDIVIQKNYNGFSLILFLMIFPRIDRDKDTLTEMRANEASKSFSNRGSSLLKVIF